MFVEGVGPVEGDLVDGVPIPAAQVDVADVVELDDGAGLGDVDGEGDEPPLADEGEVPAGVEEGDEDAHGVAGGEQVHEEEIIAVAADRARRRDEQRRRRLLALLELRARVHDLPRVPVLE